MNLTNTSLTIQKASSTRINEIDFDNLVFGVNFTDHMFECDFENGHWGNPTIKPYGNLTMSPAAKVFHYGQAVFEGMKAYKDADGSVFLFRPEDNLKRINISCKRMAIPEFPEDVFMEALYTLIDMDRDWVPKAEGSALYIRPFVIATENCVSAAASTDYKFIIILSPVNAYYSGELKVVIAENYSRAMDGGVGFAKAAGNYGAQFYPTNLAKEKGYRQVIWTDSKEHKYLEEAGTMNVFFRIGDTLITAPTSDRILDGITRKSIVRLAKHINVPVEVRPITVDEIVEAHKDGTLLEIFGSGTAAVISPVSAFSYQDQEFRLPEVTDSYARLMKKELLNIQYNKSEDPFGWRQKVG